MHPTLTEQLPHARVDEAVTRLALLPRVEVRGPTARRRPNLLEGLVLEEEVPPTDLANERVAIGAELRERGAHLARRHAAEVQVGAHTTAAVAGQVIVTILGVTLGSCRRLCELGPARRLAT